MVSEEITFHPFTNVRMQWQHKDDKWIMFFFADTKVDGKDVKVGTWLFPNDAAGWMAYLSKPDSRNPLIPAVNVVKNHETRPIGFTIER